MHLAIYNIKSEKVYNNHEEDEYAVNISVIELWEQAKPMDKYISGRMDEMMTIAIIVKEKAKKQMPFWNFVIKALNVWRENNNIIALIVSVAYDMNDWALITCKEQKSRGDTLISRCQMKSKPHISKDYHHTVNTQMRTWAIIH